MTELTRQQLEELPYRIHGDIGYALHRFGNYLAEREGYQDTELQGLDAVHFYLVQKHSWFPKDVRAMTYTDLAFVLSEEMIGWHDAASHRG